MRVTHDENGHEVLSFTDATDGLSTVRSIGNLINEHGSILSKHPEGGRVFLNHDLAIELGKRLIQWGRTGSFMYARERK